MVNAKALWESLERKYKTEDAGSKKFVVGKFLDFKMVDSKTVISQVQEFQLILHDIHAEGMVLGESFQVAALIEKLPPTWKDFKNYLKHKRKEMKLEDLIVRLRIEEDNRQSEKKADVLSLYPGRLSSRTVSTIAGRISLKDSESNSRLDLFPLLFCNLLLCFYNTTPNAYTLALRIGVQRQEPFYRWVWEANRGNPVGENATLTFGTDGNLVLAQADGRVVWQTGTANKGVFLRTEATTKLVSRSSEEQNSDGSYSLVMEPKSLAFYYTSKNSPKPMFYYQWLTIDQGSLTNVTFNAEIYTDQGDATELRFDYSATNIQFSSGGRIIARPKYNATLTYLRLGVDGNVRLYAYNILVDYRPTEVTYTLFSRDSDDVDECQLPDRCGNFRLCENNQCVACPSLKGLLGWSKECAAEK
ncbi:hypothetical protein RJ639_041768, partial [Escallonia herrerae]